MKIIVLSLSLLFASFSYAQTDKLVLKENVPEIVPVEKEIIRVSDEDWGRLQSSLTLEDWTKTSALAKEFLDKLALETKDGKVARLRYIYIYALAGKVISYSFSGDRELELKARKLLEETAENFVGKEFIFPVRKVLRDCKGALNYVCESSDNAGFVRTSATNSAGTSIHFSEYVDMRDLKFDVKEHNDSDVVLGGKLKGVRLNPNRSNILVMTLQFEKGFVDKIYPATKNQ